jgi:sugar phosphate permease
LIIGTFALKLLGQNIIPIFSRIILLNWFEKKKCTMLGISGIFLSICFGSAPFLFNSLIGKVGIEFSWIIISGLILFVFTPIIWSFGRDHPSQFGLKLDGSKFDGKIPSSKSISEAVRSPAFWLFMLACTTIASISTEVQFYIFNIFREFGYEAKTAFSFQTLTGIVSASSGFILSWLQDKVSLKYGLIFVFLLQILLLITLEFGKSGPAYYLIMLFIGCHYGIYSIIMSAPWVRLFDRKHLGNITGFVATSVAIANATGPLIMSLSKSIFATYFIATRGFMIMASILLLMAIFFTKAADMN